MKLIAPVLPGADVRQTLQHCSVPPAEGAINYAEHHCNPHVLLLSPLPFQIAYLQLWLFKLRYFPELTGNKPKLDNLIS
jgi:hypothetical protein